MAMPAMLMAGNFLSGPGGSRGPIEDLADRLRHAGAPVVCASSVKNGVLRGVDLVTTAVLKRSDYRVGMVDLYSGNAFLWGEALSIVLQRMGCPFVLVMHGGGLPDFARDHPGRVKACLKRASVVTAPSRFLQEGMSIYRPDIRLIPNPLDLSIYVYRHRIEPKPRIIWLRAFHSIYNPPLAPRALALILREFPEARMIMVGPDKGDGSLARTKQEAARLKVLDRIEFPGGVPRAVVPKFLDRGDIFLNTTDVDNTPVSVLEAMASGLCVVSTDVGGIPKLLTHEQDALLVPRDNPEAIADSVRRILTEPGLAGGLSQRGRKTAERSDWDTVLPQWMSLLRELNKEVRA